MHFNSSQKGFYLFFKLTIWWHCVGAVVLLFGTALCAAESNIEQTVNSLMEAEALAALKSASHSTPARSDDIAASPKAKTADKLHAIYGLGNKLTAEVTIDSVSMSFRSGVLQPLFGLRIGYELVNIDPPCVKLKREDVVKEICLDFKPQ